MSKMENDVNGGSTPASRETGNAQQVAPSQPPVTTSQIVALLVDTQTLVEKVRVFPASAFQITFYLLINICEAARQLLINIYMCVCVWHGMARQNQALFARRRSALKPN